jgi:hypothetical protein
MTEKLVSDEEVRAAKVLVDKVADFAGHKPIPDFIVRLTPDEIARWHHTQDARRLP